MATLRSKTTRDRHAQPCARSFRLVEAGIIVPAAELRQSSQLAALAAQLKNPPLAMLMELLGPMRMTGAGLAQLSLAASASFAANLNAQLALATGINPMAAMPCSSCSFF
jgi:hypothetical protein